VSDGAEVWCAGRLAWRRRLERPACRQ